MTKKHYPSYQTHLQIAYLIRATCWNQNCFTFILLKCPGFNAFTHVQMKFRNTSKEIQILIILKVFKSGVLFAFRSELQKCPSYFFCLNGWNSRWNWWRVLYLYCKTKGNFLTQKVKDNFSPRGISNLWHSTYHIHPLASFCGHLLRRMPDREWDALPANNIMLVPAILLPS